MRLSVLTSSVSPTKCILGKSLWEGSFTLLGGMAPSFGFKYALGSSMRPVNSHSYLLSETGARRLGFQQMGKGSLKVEYCNSPFSPSKGYWFPCGQGITSGSPCYVVKHCHPFKSFKVHRRSTYVRSGESKWGASILRPLVPITRAYFFY